MKKLIMMVLIAFLMACAPAQYKPFETPKVEFEKTATYVLDLSKLKKPEKPNYIVLDKDMNPVTAENPGDAKYLAFTEDEFKKIMALSAAYNDQTKLLKDHEDLVNTYIDEINALKELIVIKDQIIEQYKELYAMSENAYRMEKYHHKWDNVQNKIVQVIMTAGLVLLML